jgi:acetylornithine deacetylase/succinyl-diaminopimelate desuccinylase-like protein
MQHPIHREQQVVNRLQKSSAWLWAAALLAGPCAWAAEPALAEDWGVPFEQMVQHAKVKAALAFIRDDEARTLAEQKEIVVIAAPPQQEQRRAQDYVRRFAELGLGNARIDSEGNVVVVRPGTGKGPKLVISAHLDTVFPAGTDLTVKERDGRLMAPGIGDDTRGLVEMLSMARALKAADIQTTGDIWFVATVGEEGLGNLRGVRALFREHRNLDGFITIDGNQPGRITYLAVGSHRYRVTYRGPGGHSFSAFGTPSAIHALGRAIAKVADLRTPGDPKTTFTVGTVAGGTSVNTIASEATMELDMRSVRMPQLLDVEKAVMAALKEAAAEENARWGRQAISVDIQIVGQRPAGAQRPDAPIVQAAMLALRAVGLVPVLEEPGSTDANTPINLGIPAIAVGRGGANGRVHSTDEWFDPKDAYLGPQKTLLTLLALVGVEGVSKPMLPTISVP